MERPPEFELLKPPPTGFIAFGPANPSHLNACLHFCWDMQHGYEEGYRRAAELLIKHIAETSHDQDTLVYPIIFLFRHAIELRLKSILQNLNKLGERKHGVPTHHDLSKLWAECKPPLLKLTSSTDQLWLNAVDDLLEQMMKVDPASDAFRYKTKKDGSKNAEGISHINLGQFYDTVNPIAEWLGSASSYLDHLHSQMQNHD